MYENWTIEELEAEVARLDRKRKLHVNINKTKKVVEQRFDKILPINLTAEMEECCSNSKKPKQPTILQAFGLIKKTSIANVITPDTVNKESACEQHDNIQFSNKCQEFIKTVNFSQHLSEQCHTLISPSNDFVKTTKQGYRGCPRQSYTIDQKMQAVLFYNKMELKPKAVAIEISKQTGWPMATVQKWLRNERSRENIIMQWEYAAHYDEMIAERNRGSMSAVPIVPPVLPVVVEGQEGKGGAAEGETL